MLPITLLLHTYSQTYLWMAVGQIASTSLISTFNFMRQVKMNAVTEINCKLKQTILNTNKGPDPWSILFLCVFFPQQCYRFISSIVLCFFFIILLKCGVKLLIVHFIQHKMYIIYVVFSFQPAIGWRHAYA